MFSRARSLTSRTRVSVIVMAILAVLALWYRPPFAQPVPPLAAAPLASPDTPYPHPTGQTIFVSSGADLQAAINNAQPGDILALEPGATFIGNFTLPNKPGSDWLVIRSAALDSLPPPGTRVAPSDAPLLPKIVSPNTSPALATDAAAHHFHFAGIEITTNHADGGATLENLIRLESPGMQNSTSQAPTDIIFDRCYIHGTRTGSVRRGVALNSARTAVVDSYLSEFHDTGTDSQAIMGWNGPGPFKIVNNYLAAAGENLAFGGPDPTIPNLVPSDIEVRGNYFHKPLAWKPGDPHYAGNRWAVKNMLALKNARRALIENNVFENNWAEDDHGFAIVFAARNRNGRAPWSVVQDITFRKNLLRHSGAGVNVIGQDPDFPSQQTKRILIQDNLFEDIGSAKWGGSGILFQILGGTANVVIDHNTGLQNGSALVTDGAPGTGFVYQNNIASDNQSAVASTGAGTDGNGWTARFPGSVFARNVLTGGHPSSYPAENFFPASASDVGFVNLAGRDYNLAPTSPYYNAGTDGANIGADLDALLSVASSAIDGRRNS